MKTQTRKTRSIVKGLKLTLLTIMLQSSVLGFALVLKANNMLPDDFVNYSGRVTTQETTTDEMTKKTNLSKNKVASLATGSQNEVNQDELSGESTDNTVIK